MLVFYLEPPHYMTSLLFALVVTGLSAFTLIAATDTCSFETLMLTEHPYIPYLFSLTISYMSIDVPPLRIISTSSRCGAPR